MAMPKLRSRAHINLGRGISLSLPLDEIFEGVLTVGRRALVAIGNPRHNGKTKARLHDSVVAQAEIDERERILKTTEQTLIGCGYQKKQARAVIDTIRPDMLGKESHEVVAAAFRAMPTPEAK